MLDYETPVSGGIHVTGGAYGRLLLRDKNLFEEEDIFISTRSDIVYVDEVLLFSGIIPSALPPTSTTAATTLPGRSQ